VIYQGITTRIFPLLRVDYTSPQLRSQIYIDIVNWFLLFSVLLVMLVFKNSNNLTHAYGLAVSGTMAITGIMIAWILMKRNNRARTILALVVLAVNGAFLLATLHKIPEGAFWSLIFAAIPFALILIYVQGQRRLFSALRPVPFAEFLHRLETFYPVSPKIQGTALFFTRDYRNLPQYIIRTIFDNGILYEKNIIVSIIRIEHPFGKYWTMSRELTPGLSVFEIKLGYMEIVDIGAIFSEAGIEEKTIFYGMEEIITNQLVWRIFAAIKRLSPSVVQFYRLPPDKIHGVVTRIEM
jgi:KUP system potassium uptake protein